MSDDRERLLRRLETAHYAIIGALYGCRSEPASGGIWVGSPHVPDPEWNHLGRIERSPSDRAPVDRLIATARSLARRNARRPTITVSPLTRPADLDDALRNRGWTRGYRHSWLVHPDPEAADPAVPDGFTVRRATRAGDREAFLDVFSSVFTPHDPDDAAAYRAALDASFDRESTDPELTHYLATCESAPVGIASAIYVNGVAGGFNLGVLPSFRGRGIGGALTMTRLADAHRAGNDLVYLLTEDPDVEAYQLRRGHVRVMTTEGLTDPAW